MKMKRFLTVVISAFLFLNCSELNSGSKHEIKFADGRKAEVTLDFVKESKEKEILHVTFTKDEQVIKIADADQEVNEIWPQVQSEAEKKEINEALIKYVFIAEFEEASRKPVYQILLYDAERIENGSWKIVRVN